MNEWVGIVDGAIPFVVARQIATFRCAIPVLPGGDGATTAPLEERTARCEHRTEWLVGRAPTCPHHIYAAAALGVDPQPPAGAFGECEP